MDKLKAELGDHDLQLLPINKELLAQILEIENRAYSLGWTEKMFIDCLESHYLCMAYVQVEAQVKTIIGYFIVQIILDEFHLLNICIDPKFQHKGYGKRLLSNIKDMAIEQQMNRILLEVRPSNKTARKLYKNFGFERNGLRKRYYPIDTKISSEREDAILMELLLF